MKVQKDTLKNGIRLLTTPMSHLGSVTAMIGIGAGSRYEKESAQGVAHFTEHMVFKGTKKRPSSFVLSSELESLGVKFNAFTSHEATAFYTKAAAKNLPQMLDILSDIVFNSKFDSKDIDTERGVIMEELRMYKDDPKSWVNHLAYRLLFGNHPLGRDVLGTEESLTNLKREDFLNYINQWYRAKNIVVSVSGKIEEERALEEIRDVLGKLDGKKVGESEDFEENQKEPAILMESKETDQTHLVLGLRAYPRNHPQKEVLAVLNTILGGGQSSRLFEAIRVQRGLSYYVDSSWGKFSDAGVLTIHAGVNNDRVGEAIKVTLEELEKIKEEKVPEKELQKAKEIIRSNVLLGIESTDGAGFYFLIQEVLEGKTESPEEKLKKVDAVTAEDVQKVARDIFVTEGLNLALIGPASKPDRFRKLLKV